MSWYIADILDATKSPQRRSFFAKSGESLSLRQHLCKHAEFLKSPHSKDFVTPA
jgi:hypothetical protein